MENENMNENDVLVSTEERNNQLEIPKQVETLKKVNNWLAVVAVAVAFFTIGIIASYAIFDIGNREIGGAVQTHEDDLNEFFRVLHELENNHYFFDSQTNLIHGAIEGMINATGDSYTRFFTRDDFDGAMSHLQVSFYGIGAEVTTINGAATIVTPMPGSPAEAAGVLPGDVVLSVDGEDVRDYNLNEVISRIRGEYGTEVTLGILRSGSDFVDIVVTRGRIVNETVTTEILELDGQNIGLLRVSTFGAATLQDFRTGIGELESAGIDGLIIDLRNNSGGYLNAVVGMISYLLPSGVPVTSVVDRDGNATVHATRGASRNRLDVPIVTLINGGSASASEIFAAAMIESGGFEVVGTTSFGKGSVQTSRPVSEDGVLQLTIQAFFSPNGNQIDGIGVEPTIYVDSSEFLRILQINLGGEDALVYDTVHAGIRSAQQILEALGFRVDRTDGYFDSSTVAALREFQAANDLPVTGEIRSADATALSMALRGLIRNPDYDAQIQAALDVFRD